MTKKEDNREDHRPSTAKPLTRRMAIKRIAWAIPAVTAGVGLASGIGKPFGQYSSSTPVRYISIEGSYVDWVYVDYSSAYDRYMSYYSSYRSHYSSVPPPKF